MIEAAVEALRRGEIVAFPTESSYGLGVLALDAAAVARLFAKKGRAETRPVPVLVPDAWWLDRLAARVPDGARSLAARHWPGPLTIVLEASSVVPPGVCGGTGKIGLRVPGPSVALDLVRALGEPVTATSANRSGEPPATTAHAVRAAFDPDVHVLGHVSPGGPPSTVVDVTTDPFTIVRAGPIVV